MKQLLLQNIARLYYAENQLVRALNLMAGKASDPRLKEAFLSHRAETRSQVVRLASTFAELNELPQAHSCQAIDGLLENGNWLMHTIDRGPLLDCALIGAAQQVELFEVASYRNVCGLAKQLNLPGIVQKCEGILYEELEADLALSHIAGELGLDSGIHLMVQEDLRA